MVEELRWIQAPGSPHRPPLSKEKIPLSIEGGFLLLTFG